MSFTSPLPLKKVAHIREASSQRSLRDSDAVPKQWKRVNESAAAINGAQNNLESLTMQVAKMRRRILGGGSSPSGLHWQEPYKELDPTVAVAKDTFVEISPNSPLVLTGIFDLVTGELKKAKPGTWQALQDVPTQVVDPAGLPAGTYYNMPQLPYPPAAPVTVTGTPLRGDLDQVDGSGKPTVFWILWTAYPTCQ
jgi:hypothetical protein